MTDVLHTIVNFLVYFGNNDFLDKKQNIEEGILHSQKLTYKNKKIIKQLEIDVEALRRK